MHAYLVTGNNQELVQEKIHNLIKTFQAKRLDFSMQKISDVRDLGKFTNLSLNEKTAIVIENFDVVGEEAQNAFLKNLEEPQKNLIYILTAKNEESVLPTIASRCQVVEVGSKRQEMGKEDKERISKFMETTMGEKLNETSKITKREDAIQFIKEVLVFLHNKLKNDPSLVHSSNCACVACVTGFLGLPWEYS